ncbi:MAG: tetratricopeptide repeat protein [Candidatus Omnitrophica bacterium]|nr:tetratricopeptide repeat protein [Candidatus Omnitrophota bacterium]
MNCNITIKAISRYADNDCTVKEFEKIESHLKECSRCRHILHNLQMLKSSLSSIAPVKESKGFDSAFFEKLEKAGQKEKVQFSLNEMLKNTLSGMQDIFAIRAPVLVRVAASLVVTLSLLFGGYNYYTYANLPLVEGASGKADIYNARSREWVTAAANMRLRENDIIKTSQNGIVNIISRNKYAARVKEGSFITIAKLNILGHNHSTEFDVKSGRLMVNTADAFKGSNMLLKTAACRAKVVGTAFIIDVDETSGGSTWLGVLEGKVKVSSKGRDVYVDAGQKTQTQLNSTPDMPTLLSDNEWKDVQELYQLGEKPQVAILISMQPDRVKELLRPAPLYILDSAPRAIPKDLDAIMHTINKAIGDNNVAAHRLSIENLERMVKVYPNARYNAQFMMFIGSYYYYLGDYEKAINSFEKVTRDYPANALSSLAQCAIGYIYDNDLKDKAKAAAAFEVLLKKYPDSIDAKVAREFLEK